MAYNKFEGSALIFIAIYDFRNKINRFPHTYSDSSHKLCNLIN